MIFEITDKEICLTKLIHSVSNPSHGALLLFTGMVRDLNHGRNVVSISYDVFAPLAENIFKEISTEAQQLSADPVRIFISHRKGNLKVGEISVAIGVSSPHRSEAYEVSRYLIEQLKVRAPIWKKEFYEDGESEWLKGHDLCQHNTLQNSSIQTDSLRVRAGGGKILANGSE